MAEVRDAAAAVDAADGVVVALRIILYYTILYYTIVYYNILYYTIIYYTILYYTKYTQYNKL